MRRILHCLTVTVLLSCTTNITCSQSIIGFDGSYISSSAITKYGEVHSSLKASVKSPGWSVGISITERVNPFSNFQTGLYYLPQIFSVDSYIGGLGGGTRKELEYYIQNLIIPLLYDLHFGHKVSVSLDIGPFLGIIIHSEKKGTYSRTSLCDYLRSCSSSGIIEGNAKDDLSLFTFGVTSRVSLSYNFSTRTGIFIRSGYSRNLSNLLNSFLEQTESLKYQSWSFSFGLTYSLTNFDLSKTLLNI